MISRKRLKEVLHYDPVTGRWTWLVSRSCMAKKGAEAGRVATTGYRQITVCGRTYDSSNLAWFYMKGRWPKKIVDHKDRNKSNDVFTNFRLANRSQNQANSKGHGGVTGVKGVFPCNSRKNPFRARIVVDGKGINLGCHPNVDAASEAYRIAAQRHFGEFASA